MSSSADFFGENSNKHKECVTRVTKVDLRGSEMDGACYGHDDNALEWTNNFYQYHNPRKLVLSKFINCYSMNPLLAN